VRPWSEGMLIGGLLNETAVLYRSQERSIVDMC
jgi:hypothetical protein